MKAKLSDLINALESHSDEYRSAFDRQTGQVVAVEDYILRAVEEEDNETLATAPDWQKAEIEIARAMLSDTGGRFIDPPDPFEFHEYRHMERFIGTVADQSVCRANYGARSRGVARSVTLRTHCTKAWDAGQVV